MKISLSIGEIAEITSGTLLSGDPAKIIDIIEIDSRDVFNPLKSCFVCLAGTKTDGHTYISELFEKGCDSFIVTKNVKLSGANIIQVEDAVKALQDLAAFHRSKFTLPVVGITGSNGKTIVKEWLYELLNSHLHIIRSPKSYNSQIGVALSVLHIRKEHQLALFEAGISELGEMDKLERMIQPTLGVFTGIGDAHSAGFTSKGEKIKEKFRLFKNCKTLICHQEYACYFDGNKEVWGTDLNNVFTENNQTKLVLKGKEYALDFHTQFSANLINAVLAANQFCELELVLKSIHKLHSLSLRLETEEGKNGNLIINDAYSFDLESLKIALHCQQTEAGNRSTILIASSPKETHLIQEFCLLIQQYKLNKLYLIGESILPKGALPKAQVYKDLDELMASKKLSGLKNTCILIKGYREDQLEKISINLEKITHKTWLEIDTSALRHNIQTIKQKLSPSTKLLVMVKASAYGGGLDRIGKTLENEQVDYLGVAYTEEGVQLRAADIHLPILVMNSEHASFQKLVTNRLEPSIFSFEILEEFIRFLIKKGLKNYPIHLKIETGMNRLGFALEDLQVLINKLDAQPEVLVKSVFSHLSSSDDPAEIEWTKKQIKKFDQANKILEEGLDYKFDRHLYNTNGILNLKKNPYEMVRLGIGLYGISEPKNQILEPVLHLKTKITQIKTIHKGDSVGYSRSFIAEKEMKIGIIAIGYADGLLRSYSKEGEVFVNGKRSRILGNICMDMTIIDLSEINVQLNDEVEIFGKHIHPKEVADKSGTIPYEIFTRISDRVKRLYLE